MAKKVLILRWAGSSYDSLGGLLELTAREFAALGISARIVAADGEGWPTRLIELLKSGEFAFALTMSGMGSNLFVDGKLVWETAKVPLFNWNCDHPCHFPVRHGIRSPFLLHGYVFPDHARYNIEHLKPNGAAYAVHLGIPPRTLFPEAPLPLARRNGRIIFSKSGRDINEIEAEWRSYAPDLQHIVFTAAEDLLWRSTADFLPVLQAIAEPRGLFLTGNNRLTMLLIREIDFYIRYKRGNLTMAAIRRYPVDVFGSGWDHIDWDDAEAKFHGPLNWRATIERLPHFNGCLSINPLVEESVHDRVFFGLAAGVPPISDANAFARQHMPALTPYAFEFSPASIQRAIEALLTDPSAAIVASEATWQALAEPFGLRHSAQQIVQFAMLHHLNMPTAG